MVPFSPKHSVILFYDNIFENLRVVQFQKLRKGLTVRTEEISKELLIVLLTEFV